MKAPQYTALNDIHEVLGKARDLLTNDIFRNVLNANQRDSVVRQLHNIAGQFDNLVQEVNEAICTVRGHDWEDQSSAGPDSGDVTVECKRCGEFHHTQLY